MTDISKRSNAQKVNFKKTNSIRMTFKVNSRKYQSLQSAQNTLTARKKNLTSLYKGTLKLNINLQRITASFKETENHIHHK